MASEEAKALAAVLGGDDATAEVVDQQFLKRVGVDADDVVTLAMASVSFHAQLSKKMRDMTERAMEANRRCEGRSKLTQASSVEWRGVATLLRTDIGAVQVSTVWMPHLEVFETCVFGHDIGEETRAKSREAATEQHFRAVKLVLAARA